MRVKDLKIGMEIYQYNTVVLRYIITAISTLKTNGHEEKFYIAECQTCADHDKCEVAFIGDNSGNLVYSHMINAYDDDNEYHKEHGHYRNSQYYWHKAENHNFFLTRKEARLYVHEENLKFYKNRIEECKKSIKGWEKDIENTKAEIEVLTNN